MVDGGLEQAHDGRVGIEQRQEKRRPDLGVPTRNTGWSDCTVRLLTLRPPGKARPMIPTRNRRPSAILQNIASCSPATGYKTSLSQAAKDALSIVFCSTISRGQIQLRSQRRLVRIIHSGETRSSPLRALAYMPLVSRRSQISIGVST